MASTYSLNILKTPYSYALRHALGHDCYIDSFNTARHQHENFSESSPFIDDFSKYVFTLGIGLPYPTTVPIFVENAVDLCEELFLQKNEYNYKLSLYLDQYKGHKWLTKKYVRETKHGMLPKYIFDLATGQVRDPDPYFNENYNWYYTGGILDKCSIFNEEYLIYTNNENFLCFKNNTEESHIRIKQLDDTAVLNVKCIGDNIVLLRQKYKICALRLHSTQDEFSFDVFKTETCNDNVPYIDVKYNNNELSTLTLNYKIKAIDLQSETSTIHNFDKLHNNQSDNGFGQFDYLNENNLLFLDRISVRIYDKRSQEGKHFIVKDSWFKCDHLCNFAMSKNTNYVFLSTLHKIIKFDLRQMNVVKTWTHMLPSPPIMMKTEYFHDAELIFASAQKYNDRIILLSNDTESNLVQLVPNNADTLQECNKFHNFKLCSEHEERLKYSTAGISIVQSQNDVNLYTCNTIGDVFKNTMTQDSTLDLTESLQKLDTWMKSFPRRCKPLIVTNIRELSHVKNALKEPINVPVLDTYTKENRKRLKFVNDVKLENVDMAAIWLDDDEEKKEDVVLTASINTKVSEWLHHTVKNDDEYMLENIF